MKFFTLILATSIASSAFGQTSLGVRGGFLKTEFVSTSPSSRTSSSDNWTAGLYANVPLKNNFYIQVGANYAVKGATIGLGNPHPDYIITTDVSRVKLNYLELPVNFVYKINIGIGKIVFGGGPYGAYCVRGNYKVDIYENGNKVQSNFQRINFNATPNVMGTGSELHRWDAGVDASAGVEFNCFLTLGFHYSRGLVDIDKGVGEFKNQFYGVKLGILFDREDW